MSLTRSECINLPAELWMDIIECGSRQDLMNWICVCRILLGPARALLFRTLDLPTLSRCEEFLEPATNPTSILPHVRHLCLIRSSLSESWDWKYTTVPALLEVLPRLESISIALAFSDPTADATLLEKWTRMQNRGAIRRVSLQECSFGSISTFHAMLAVFPALRELSMGSVGFLCPDDNSTRQSQAAAAQLSLESLEIALDSSLAQSQEDIFTWLSSSVLPGSVTSLRCDYGGGREMDSLRRLFSIVGSSVTTLDISRAVIKVPGLISLLGPPLLPALTVLCIAYKRRTVGHRRLGCTPETLLTILRLRDKLPPLSELTVSGECAYLRGAPQTLVGAVDELRQMTMKRVRLEWLCDIDDEPEPVDTLMQAMDIAGWVPGPREPALERKEEDSDLDRYDFYSKWYTCGQCSPSLYTGESSQEGSIVDVDAEGTSRLACRLTFIEGSVPERLAHLGMLFEQ